MSEKLKPCPFCGRGATLEEIEPHKHENAILPDHPGSWFVECRCGVAMIGDDKQEVAERWNRRTCPNLSDDEVKQPCIEGPCGSEPRQLTLDELKQMDDGYVWIQDWSEDLPFKTWGEKRGDRITALIWNDVAGYGIVVKDLDDRYYRKLYGKEWAAYDRPPGGNRL